MHMYVHIYRDYIYICIHIQSPSIQKLSCLFCTSACRAGSEGLPEARGGYLWLASGQLGVKDIPKNPIHQTQTANLPL